MEDFSFYPRYQKHIAKRILAIDFGTKVIGTAMYCPGQDPFPYIAEKIIYKSHEESIKGLKSIVENEGIDILVFGVPYFLDGGESDNTKRIKEFGKLLEAACPDQEFFEQDETLTTKAAEDRMKSSPQFNFKVDVTKIDCVAATIILEDFIKS
ncbi:MAG: Holliday junction resolvase RuvX [Bacteriovorax sp.]|nr:Holliday junction resolvase RuvX [Bacteriovorax sp.]